MIDFLKLFLHILVSPFKTQARLEAEIVLLRHHAMGIRDHPTAPRSPWQNGHAERLIGSIRRECLNHIVVFGEAYLRRILAAYTGYYNPASKHPSVYVIEENRFC
jgi:transposase InsO family protein